MAALAAAHAVALAEVHEVALEVAPEAALAGREVDFTTTQDFTDPEYILASRFSEEGITAEGLSTVSRV